MNKKPSRKKKTAYHEPESVEAITDQNVKAITELEEAARAHRSVGDRISDQIARFCGTMTFVWVHVAWFAAWIIINNFFYPFDKYPYNFLTLVVSLEAIFLSTFILISQNHDSRMSESRNHLDLQINLLTEQENTKMLRMLESIGRKVGADISHDPSVHVLDQATQPKKLAEQIETAAKRKEGEKS
ncbi:MAG: DUF1003 domain-containing protein [Chthoniobacterales bacterium]